MTQQEQGYTAQELLANMQRLRRLPPEEKSLLIAEVQRENPNCSVWLDEMGVIHIWSRDIHISSLKKRSHRSKK